MTAKEYLSQAYYLDQQINMKLDQLSSLRCLATKTTNVVTGMPGTTQPNGSLMAEAVIQMVDLEHLINRDIDRLVDLKKEMQQGIDRMTNQTYRTILERRYLNQASWEAIAGEMGYGMDNLYKLHQKALDEFQKTLQ